METPSVDELLGELLDAINVRPIPAKEEGWFTVADMMAEAPYASEDTIRNKCDEKAKQGLFEKQKANGKSYYRKVKHESD